MTRWKKWIGVALLFLLGFLCGLASGRFLRWGAPPSPDRILARIGEDLSEQLQLSPEQQQVFEEAARDAQSQLREVHRSVRPQIEKIFDQVQDRLIPVLTEEQKEKLEEIRQRRRMLIRRPPRRGLEEDEGP
jgi:uncharacterized membrane protein